MCRYPFCGRHQINGMNAFDECAYGIRHDSRAERAYYHKYLAHVGLLINTQPTIQ